MNTQKRESNSEIVIKKLEIMKRVKLFPLVAFLVGILVVLSSCETDPVGGGLDGESILPEKMTIDIPDAISQSITSKKSKGIDTLNGNDIY